MSISKREERAQEKRIKKIEAKECEYNMIRKPTNVLFNAILTILSLLSLIPFVFVIIISLLLFPTIQLFQSYIVT